VIPAKGQCFSTGDALREIEAHGGITNDFVLVPGDVVANLDLAPIIAAHKARREADRDAVLTTLMTSVPPRHRCRRAGDEVLVVMSGETGRLLHYEEGQNSVSNHKLEMPMTLLQETDRLQIQRDLYDTHIDICAPELLVLLQDNFDWQDLRRDVLPGILGQFEMLGKTIYTHVITNEYAARVHDAHTYDVISRDVLQRWTYPLVPDANLLPGSSYRCGRGCVYKEDRLVLARNCQIHGASAIGAGTSVGFGSSISASVLGPGCCVGAEVNIERSYLWRNVKVEDGARVCGAICCDGVVIGRDAVVETGCILGPGVCVPAGATLLAYSRHTALSPETLRKLAEELDDDDDDTRSEASDMASGAEVTLGAGGDSTGSSLGAQLDTMWRIVGGPGSMCHERSAAKGPIAEELSEPEEEDFQEDAAQDEEAVEEEQFASEVEATVQRGIENDHTVENVALEVNSLKFAQNRSFADCVQAMLPTLMASLGLPGRPKKERPKEVVKMLGRWGRLLGRFVQSPGDQDVLLATLISLATEEDALAEIFQHLLHAFYDCDEALLPEEAIMRWVDSARTAPNGSPTRMLLAKAEPFITWLQEAEEDDEDDD